MESLPDNKWPSDLLESLSKSYEEVQPWDEFPLLNSQGFVIHPLGETSKAHNAILKAYNNDLLQAIGWKSGIVITYDPLARRLHPVFFNQKGIEEDITERRNQYIEHLKERCQESEYEIFERQVWEEKIHPGIGILPAMFIHMYNHRNEATTDWSKIIGFTFYEPDLTGKDSIVTKHGRQFFVGGGVITPCIFNKTLLGFSIVEQLPKESDFAQICKLNEFFVNSVAAPFLYTELITRLRDLEAYFLGLGKDKDRIRMLPILNKRALYDRLKLYMNNVKKDLLTRFSVSFLDIDNFGLCNELIGHQGTDKLMIDLAEILVRMWQERPEVEVGRFGGDEFVVIAPNMTATDLAEKMQALRQGFRDLIENKWGELNIKFVNKGKKLSLSIGITEYPDDFEKAKSLLNTIQIDNSEEYQLLDIANEHTQKIVKKYGKDAYLLTRQRLEFVQLEIEHAQIRDRYFCK